MEKIILDKLEEINSKIYKIQKKQEELFEKYNLLLTEQKKENEDIYKILQQLLLKDLLSTYKNEVTSFLSEQNISDKNNISENLRLREVIKEKDPDMVLVKGGIYKSDFFDGEKEISDLYVSKYQITQNKWKKYMKINPSKFKGEKKPVENILWIEALEFCNKMSESYKLQPVYKIKDKKLSKIIYKNGKEVNPYLADFSRTEGYRLPTEVEWEWFAKGGKEILENENIDEIAWYFKNSCGQTNIVGIKKPNILQLYDCIGNVWEWCYDTVNGNILSKRIRGGSWCDIEPYCSVTYRAESSSHSYNIGFRIVRTADK